MPVTGSPDQEVPFGAIPLPPESTKRDPATGIPGAAPNFGDFMLPHVYTFQAVTSSPSKVYRPSDEALKASYDNAKFMRNDLVVRECTDARQRAVALLDWHIEPEDEKDPQQVELCANLTKLCERIPRFMQYRENLLHATWFGKYGVSHKWGWENVSGAMRVAVKKWKPVHGDKIVFRFDDGSHSYEDEQVGIRVGAGYQSGKTIDQRQVEATDYGLAYFLDRWERSLIAIHKHYIEDGEYEDPNNAGRIHGVGLRSVIYWTWYQKQETLAFLMEFLERSATGIEIWYYPYGNKEAEDKTRQAAQERIGQGRNIIMVPRPMGEEGQAYGVERIEPGMAGAEAIKTIITEYFGHLIKRYILGQTLTSEAAGTGLGSNLADIHLGTFLDIIRYDARLLEETITTDLLEPLKRYNFPEFAGVRVKFVIETEQADVGAKLEAYLKAFQMGLRFKATDVAELIGVAMPSPDDEELSMAAQKQQDAANQAAAQPPGMDAGGAPGGAEQEKESKALAPGEIPGADALGGDGASAGDSLEQGDTGKLLAFLRARGAILEPGVNAADAYSAGQPSQYAGNANGRSPHSENSERQRVLA